MEKSHFSMTGVSVAFPYFALLHAPAKIRLIHTFFILTRVNFVARRQHKQLTNEQKKCIQYTLCTYLFLMKLIGFCIEKLIS